MYHYAAGKSAWLAAGLPTEGRLRDEDRAGAVARRDVPRVRFDATVGDAAALASGWEVVVVVSGGERDVVVGAVDASRVGDHPAGTAVAEALSTAPRTVRPGTLRNELLQTMLDDDLTHVLVTTPAGALIGLVRRDDLGGGG